MSSIIKTNIKFCKGLDNVSDKLCGFVTKTNGSWRGCRQECAVKKKIVLVDSALAHDIIPNRLYLCTLIPMRGEGGFIAVSAELVKFHASILARYRQGEYSVTVKFGHKVVTYDPAGSDKGKRDIQHIARCLRSRVDLQNALAVAEDFISAAVMVRRRYKQSLALVP